MKQILKILFAVTLIGISVSLILSKKSLSKNLALVTKDNSQLKLEPGSEILETTSNDGENIFNTNKIDFKDNSLFKINEKLNLNLIDKANPNNIKKINTRVIENNIIVDFEKPEDNGTNYEYVVRKDSNEKKLNFYSKSDVKGYGYVIDNDSQNKAPENMNKYNEESIVQENINWLDDYYLHIRTFDGNGNSSENKTFKLDLPSNGVTVKYVDINSNSEIEREEHISGVVKQPYDVSDLSKSVDNYQLIGTQGELEGTLKKEKINIIYEYARNSSVTVNYIDRETEHQISKSTIIDGYEGKEILVNAKDISGYSCEQKNYLIKMNPNNNVLNIYYDEIPKGTIITRYVDKETNEEIFDSSYYTDYANNEYSTEAKEIEGYELIETPDKASGVIGEGTDEVIYYYNKIKEEKGIEENENSEKNMELNKTENVEPKEITIKHMDYNTKKVIKTEKVKIQADKASYKLKNMEGYKIMCIDDFENETLIDELIRSLSEDENFIKINEDSDNIIAPKTINPKVVTEYEIVLNCDDSDYIIYYKK